jgi:hypothetical protein
MSSKATSKSPPRVARLTIGSLDNPTLTVIAQYNPKEIELARTVPWQKHNSDNTPEARRKKPAPGSDVEYTGGEGRTISLELLFDELETGKSVLKQLLDLDEMATPRDASSTKTELRRPHQCVVVWGAYADLEKAQRPKEEKAMRPLRCVIDSLTVKYTMFSSDGVPLRAMANVKLREASVKVETTPDVNRAHELANLRYEQRAK